MSTQAVAGEPRLVVALAAGCELGPDRVGSKAFNLACLIAAGLPVPPGFVVMPEAFEAWGVAEPAVIAAASDLGADRYAVRSSAVAEDLRGRPMPGCTRPS
jgi:phosphoenolpyruvate synthase/pyruvate phosphate dikinase